MERQRIKRTWGVTIAGVCLLILGVLLAVCMGAMKILPVDIWNGIFHNTGSLTDMMIRDVRLPRVICVLVTGGILGMTGAMMQGVTRNPIAEPSLLGISQGATLFVALLYASGVGATAGNTLLAALLGAFFFRRACTYIYHEKSGKFKFWVSGGFRGATWLDVKIILAVGIPGFLAAVFLAPKINVISLGDDMATGLGIHPQRVRFITILLMIPLCAAAVVVGKTIGFVGLMIPQTIRLFAGTDYRRVIPLSFLCGAVLLTYADSLMSHWIVVCRHRLQAGNSA